MSGEVPEAAMQAAVDPTTDARELERLMRAYPGQNALRKCLARHPNAPLRLFVDLVSVVPLAALENPALELYGVEDPGWLGRLLPRDAFVMLFARAGERLDALVPFTRKPISAQATRAMRARQLLPEAVCDVVRRRPWHEWPSVLDVQLLQLGTREPTLRGVVLELLVPEQYRRAEWLSPAWLEAMATHPSENVRASIAAHGALGLAWQRRLAKDPALLVRWTLATHEALDAAAAARLAGDSDERVRARIASRTDLDDAALRRLVADPVPRVADAAWRTCMARRHG